MGDGTGVGGQRVAFYGDGAKLFMMYLLYLVAPIFVGVIVFGFLGLIGEKLALVGGGIGVFGVMAMGVSGLALIACEFGAIVISTNKFLGYYYEALTIDRQPCQYTGTPRELANVLIVNTILTSITCGIYIPWAMVRMKEFVDSKVLVNGQPNRLTFYGDPASFLGTYILGMILATITCGIYGPWFANDVFAFMWENTRLDGRPFQFRKNPRGFFGTYLINVILMNVTCGIYYPWAICNILKWEADRVA